MFTWDYPLLVRTCTTIYISQLLYIRLEEHTVAAGRLLLRNGTTLEIANTNVTSASGLHCRKVYFSPFLIGDQLGLQASSPLYLEHVFKGLISV